MKKAMETGADPFLSLLDWRNTPSEQLLSSPVQLLMGRRTRSTLPVADRLLGTPSSANAKAALT